MAIVTIQGIDCTYRDLLPDEEILYSQLPQEQQFYKRIEHPFINEDELVEIASVAYDERKSKYNKLQSEWVDREEKRMTYGNGVYANINGIITYIPASYWGYINYWELEHGEMPEYRESDRIFFLFMEFLYFETDVLAVTRGKGRRQGATSIGFYWMWWICGRMEEKRGGSISFNDDAAKKNFQTMFMRGFKAMLPCFVRDFDSTAENFVRFVKPVEKAKKGVIKKRQGLNSYCDNLANSINAYDSGRLSFGNFDESGKYDKMDINTYWSKVSPTLKQGRNKIGFAYLPTTVNPKKKGGEKFKKFWTEADQNAINPNTGKAYGLSTPHKVVRYFVPATEGYAGCIDKFGASIIEDPIEPILGNDGKMITEGSRTVIEKERSLKEGEQLMEHRRDFPLDQNDMFSFETGQCEFNEKNFIERIIHLERHPEEAYWRQVRFFETYNKDGKLEVNFADDPKGDWWLREKPDIPNNYKLYGRQLEPLSSSIYSLGADTYKNIFAINGSDGAISIIKKSIIKNGKETGLYPVAFFVGRPKLIKQFNWQAFLGCLWYGAKINYELDAGSWFYEDFLEWNALRFLEWTPAVDLTNPRYKIKPGTESGNPFQLAKQLEVAKMYFDGTSLHEYNGNVHRVNYIPLLKQGLEYNHSERTPYHLVVSFMMALLPMLGQTKPPNLPQRTMPVFPTHQLRVKNWN